MELAQIAKQIANTLSDATDKNESVMSTINDVVARQMQHSMSELAGVIIVWKRKPLWGAITSASRAVLISAAGFKPTSMMGQNKEARTR